MTAQASLRRGVEEDSFDVQAIERQEPQGLDAEEKVLWASFCVADASGDGKLSRREFAEAVELAKDAGIDIGHFGAVDEDQDVSTEPPQHHTTLA